MQTQTENLTRGHHLSKQYDVVIIGSGPNGLAAAITLAQAGLSVVIYEAKSTIGGGMRSSELTLPGYIHDICSAIHPLAVASPFFQTLPLDQYGLEWIEPPVALAHPFDQNPAVILDRSLETTAQNLGVDAKIYTKLYSPLVRNWKKIGEEILSPFHFPRHPFRLARFGSLAIRSAEKLWNRFHEDRTKGLFAGMAGHSMMPLDRSLTGAFGLILGTLGHSVGWPFPKGGAQKIADALAAFFESLGGEIVTEHEIKNIDDLPPCRIILCDISPKQFLKLAGHRLPQKYQKRLMGFRYGPGVFKIDWALNHPIPWKDPQCMQAGTLHLGGSAEEIRLAEQEVWSQTHPKKPFVILAQQSLFDPSRAPHDHHVAWAYCHVPANSNFDMTERIETQVERFAPGFRDCILAKSTKTPIEMEQYNANYIGGDINGGVQDLFQHYSRPVSLFSPYSTPIKGLYLCSSSTPPGGGVHGMCGYHAARAALKCLKH